MGGRAFGGLMPRLDLATYRRICATLQVGLQPFFRQVEVPRCLPTKRDFGDVDLLVAGRTCPFDPQHHLGSSMMVRNGNVLSFEFEGYQIDLLQSEDITDMHRFFSDYGDMGMLLGIMLSRYGLRLNPKGLSIILPCEMKLHLTNDLQGIFSLLRMSGAKWREGFADAQEVFEFLSTCCLCSNTLKLSNRHKQRPGVVSFLSHITHMPKVAVDQTAFRKQAISTFNKDGEVQAILDKIARRGDIKKKFNGRLVMEWTGVKGPAVGLLMAEIERSMPTATMSDMSGEDIRNGVLTIHATFSTPA